MSEYALLRKCRSACYHAREWWRRVQDQHQATSRRRAFETWLKLLKDNRPDVFVGANFVEFGGTRHHMHSLKAFSSLKVELIPDDQWLKRMTQWSLTTEFHNQFLQFDSRGLKAAHSHVFPWFIEWCHYQQQTNGLRWIHTHHNWYYPEFGRGELEPWQEEFNEQFLFALRHADVCLSVSKWQRDFLKKSFDLETHYLPNGVNVATCDASNAERARRRTELDEFVLFAGRNDPVKNPVDFVKLALSLPEQQFLMLGQGLSHATLRSDWDVVVPHNLKVMGEATHQETLDAIAACSALVVTSKREGLPTLVLEAMTLGKPIVVPEEDGCMEAVGHGDFGFIYRHGDIDHLSAMTLEAVSDQSRCHKSREHVMQEYDWRVVMRKLDRIYTGANAP
jgi:glycosyltransferase involved in cell wall biosynthesis